MGKLVGDISIYFFLVTFARFLTMVLIVVDVLTKKNFDTGVVMNNITTSQMQPFKNKVGGHTPIFSISKQEICKELNNTERNFYKKISKNHPLFYYMPRYKGSNGSQIILEDLTSQMRTPCILDLKMGTRQYGCNATITKQQSHRAKARSTTTRKLGVRICGLQIFNYQNKYFYQDKYLGRKITVGKQFGKILAKFLYNGHDIYSLLNRIPHLIDQLKELYTIFTGLPGYRMYGSLILLMYEGGEDNLENQVKVKIIDFANAVIAGEENIDNVTVPPQHPDSPDLGYLRGLNSLIVYFTLIFSILSRIKLNNTEEMVDWIQENKQTLKEQSCPWLDDYAELDGLKDGGIHQDMSDDPFDIEYPEYTPEEDEGLSE